MILAYNVFIQTLLFLGRDIRVLRSQILSEILPSGFLFTFGDRLYLGGIRVYRGALLLFLAVFLLPLARNELGHLQFCLRLPLNQIGVGLATIPRKMKIGVNQKRKIRAAVGFCPPIGETGLTAFEHVPLTVPHHGFLFTIQLTRHPVRR